MNPYRWWRLWLQRRRVARCNALLLSQNRTCSNPADHYPLRWPHR